MTGKSNGTILIFINNLKAFCLTPKVPYVLLPNFVVFDIVGNIYQPQKFAAPHSMGARRL
jgi:hypothetical protein